MCYNLLVPGDGDLVIVTPYNMVWSVLMSLILF